MKIILTVIICSAVSGMCGELWVKDIPYKDWDSCMRAGYIDSLEWIEQAGPEYVNKNQMYVRFMCQEVPLEDTDT